MEMPQKKQTINFYFAAIISVAFVFIK